MGIYNYKGAAMSNSIDIKAHTLGKLY